MSNTCRICGNTDGNRNHRAREMMFGTRDEFDYLECSQCGTVQIAEVPDLARYYPAEYYSLDADAQTDVLSKFRRRIITRLAAKYVKTGRGDLGRWIVSQRGWIEDLFPKWLRISSINIDDESKVLDLGCGTGRLLRTMRIFGFRNLTGADPFIHNDVRYPDGVTVYKRGAAEMEPDYDLVMLHHSFEHFADPVGELRAIRRLVRDDGVCLIRLPIVNYAWEKYGVNWVQLDPPRHLFLYTESSFRQMATNAGFAVTDVVYDSDEFQFYGSEQYEQNIPLNDERAYRGTAATSIFTEQQIENWRLEAAELNACGKGDQACFILTRADL